MTDAKPQAKPSILDRLREFMDSLGSEQDPPAEDLPAEDPPAEDPPAEDPPAEDPPAEDPPADPTPGTEQGTDPEEGDLRETIRQQASQIEAYRNALAQAGMDDPLADEIDATANLDPDADTLTEDEAVAAFDEDYARQEAMLAELTKEN